MWRVAGLVVSALLAMPWLAAAGHAACNFSSSTLPAEAFTKFTLSPRSLLNDFPNGGIELEGSVGELAMSTTAMLKPIGDAARYANLRQSEAIGSALARSFRKCRGKEEALAAMIRHLALTSPNSAVRRAFLDHTDLDDIDPASKAGQSAEVEKSHSMIRIDPDSKRLPSPFAPIQLH